MGPERRKAQEATGPGFSHAPEHEVHSQLVLVRLVRYFILGLSVLYFHIPLQEE